MSTLQITLPDEVKAVADAQVASGRFASHSEYFRSLVEEDRRRLAGESIEAMLVARIEGTQTIEMDAADWRQMREEFQRRVAQTSGK